MPNVTLYEDEKHRNVLLEDFSKGEMLPANQHLIVHGEHGVLIDPGGRETFEKVLFNVTKELGKAHLEHIFLSHQDPDVVGSIDLWLRRTHARAWVSRMWMGTLPHFDLDPLVTGSLRSIPDEGTSLKIGKIRLWVIPAHFLHSPGNFQLYDPVSKILYTADLGASLDVRYRVVPNVEEHIPRMQPFLQRHIATTEVLRAWVDVVRPLNIHAIAPQHGAVIKGRDSVRRFLDWCATVACGIDAFPELFTLPPGMDGRSNGE